MRVPVFLISATLLSVLSSGRAACQQPISALPVDEHTPFLIAVVDDWRYGNAVAVIERRPSEAIPDRVVYPRSSVNPSTLAAGVRQLAGLRAAFGDSPTRMGVYRVRDDGKGWVRRGEPENWMSLIRHSRARIISGLGTANFVVLYLPDQTSTR